MTGSVVLTHDLDFGSILAATNRDGPSVIQVRSENVTFEAIGSQVVGATRQMRAELEQGALLTVDSRRARIRILPLERRN